MAALRALGETGSPDAGSAILDWLRTLAPQQDQRERLIPQALLALGRLNHSPAFPLMEAVLRGSIRGARCGWAIHALVLFSDPAALQLLQSFANSGAEPFLRSLALARLEQVDPAFREDREQTDREWRLEARRSQIAIFLRGKEQELPDTLAGCVAALHDFDADRRLSAIGLLALQDELFPAGRVVDLLKDADPRVRANAAFALGMRGSSDHAAEVRVLLQDASGLVRYCAREALDRLLDVKDRNPVG